VIRIHEQVILEINEAVCHLREKVVELEAEIAELEVVKRWHLKQLGREDTPEPSGRFAEHSFPRAAEAVLREAGQPLGLKEIAEAILRGGKATRSPRNFRVALGNAMATNPNVFARVSRGVWGLTLWQSQSPPAEEPKP
jgi:hypothetical protein